MGLFERFFLKSFLFQDTFMNEKVHNRQLMNIRQSVFYINS